MGQKKKKNKTENTSNNSSNEKKNQHDEENRENGSQKSFTSRLFVIVIGLSVVVAMAAVIYTDKGYKTFISDMIKKTLPWQHSKKNIEPGYSGSVDVKNDFTLQPSERTEQTFTNDQHDFIATKTESESVKREYEEIRPTRQSDLSSIDAKVSIETETVSVENKQEYAQIKKTGQSEDFSSYEDKVSMETETKPEENKQKYTQIQQTHTPEEMPKHDGNEPLEMTKIDTSVESREEFSAKEEMRDGKVENLAKVQSNNKKEIENTQKEADYAKISITNEKDYILREELDKADKYLSEGNIEEALYDYDEVLLKCPQCPRAYYGKAETLEKMAEQQRSNALLEEAIATFQRVLDLNDVPAELMIKAGTRLADRLQFRGWGDKASKTLRFLSSKFPQDLDLKRKLGVSYLLTGQINNAKLIFQEILSISPTDGFSKVHLGFIIKTSDNDPEKAIPFLKEGIQSKAEGTQDGRFYFHLGDAYQRLGRTDEAYKLYEDGADRGLFRSTYQRSLYNVDHLTGKPWWKAEQTGYESYLKMLEENWRVIKEEGISQLDIESGAFLPEEENLREKGDWKQLTLYQQGRKNKENCARAPRTCELIDRIPDAKGCKRGQVKFSVMHPGVHVWPHCGPTNCRLRAHLGLVVPKGPKIRVGNVTRQWSVGKFIIFDDSFEHEVWHNGTDLRLVLIVDFWHPELTAAEKRNLSPI